MVDLSQGRRLSLELVTAVRQGLCTSEISTNGVAQPMVNNDATIDLEGMAIAETTVGSRTCLSKIEVRPGPGKDRLTSMLNA